MHTTRTLSTKAALFALMGLALAQLVPAAYAQPQSRSTSRAQRLEWPRTFTGQPDFMFTRDEAMGEARARAARENEPLPLTPSLPQLINDDTPLDPLGITTPQVEETSTDPSDTVADASGTMPIRGQTLMDRLMAQAVELPTVAAAQKVDLTEFTTQLNATISRTIAGWEPQPGRYDFGGALNSLVLQAIVTSPVRYAVINQHRYSEGETFRITVPLPVPDAIIQSALMAQMPISGTLPPQLQASYDEAYKDVWDKFTFKRNQNPEIGRQTLVLPVRITSISPRQVMLDVNGQSYALGIRYAY